MDGLIDTPLLHMLISTRPAPQSLREHFLDFAAPRTEKSSRELPENVFEAFSVFRPGQSAKKLQRIVLEQRASANIQRAVAESHWCLPGIISGFDSDVFQHYIKTHWFCMFYLVFLLYPPQMMQNSVIIHFGKRRRLDLKHGLFDKQSES